jgi:hypothetical protein
VTPFPELVLQIGKLSRILSSYFTPILGSLVRVDVAGQHKIVRVRFDTWVHVLWKSFLVGLLTSASHTV